MNLYSIIIPIYNVAPYLDACIESAVRQTYKNLEIILVDDGSNDESGYICDIWAKKDKRIKVIHQANSGPSAARNNGLAVAEGEFICFLDGDDYIEETLIETVHSYFDQGIDHVVFQIQRVCNGRQEELPDFEVGMKHISDTNERLSFFVTQFFQFKIGYGVCNRAFRKKIIEDYNINFACNLKTIAEDMYFLACYCSFIKNYIVIPDKLYYYRQHPNSIMDQQRYRLNAGTMTEVGKELLSFLRKHDQCAELVEHFSVFFHFIMRNTMDRYQNKYDVSARKMRKDLLEDIADFEFFKNYFLLLRKEKESLRLLYSKITTAKVINQDEYYATGYYWIYIVKRIGLKIAEIICG